MSQDPLKPKDSGKIGMPRVDDGMNKLPPVPQDGGKGSKDDSKIINPKDDEKILARARKRFDRCISSEAKNRQMALEDIKFLNGDQWPADVAAQRNTDKRPCLTFNKLKTFVHQVTNAQRENRPSICISPVGDNSDVKAAKMYSAIVRAIERDSSADIAYDTGFWNAVSNGYGYWRVLTEYESEKSFDQKIIIQRIRNPFTVYLDPYHIDPEGADAQYGFITEMMPRDEFEQKYPDSQIMSWTAGTTGDTYKEWVTKDSVRVAEYYEIEHTMSDLVHLDTGHVGFRDDLSDEVNKHIKEGTIKVVNERKSERQTTRWYMMSALDILDRTDVPTDGLIPIVKVIGDEIDEQGKVTYSGIVRDAKDPQRMYNYWKTTEAEVVALQPKAPFIMEEGQVEGHEPQWKQANTKAFPYLLYKATNIGGKPAPPPQRQPMMAPPAAVLQAIQGAAQDMMAVTGIRFDATLAERVHDESGLALREIRRSGDIGSFHYVDNLGRSLKYTGRIILKMIPKVMDTARVLTVIREDGKEQSIRIDPNAPKAISQGKTPQGKTLVIFNPNVGTYGVTVTVGPSYATKRIESSEQMMRFVSAMPETGKLVADLIAKNQDWPEAEQFALRLAKTIPPNIMAPPMEDVDPQIQAMIQSMQMQIKQMMMERMQMQKQIQDQTADRMILQGKYDQDFEAKVLGIMQKMDAANVKSGVDHSQNVASHTLEVMKYLQPQQQQDPSQMTPDAQGQTLQQHPEQPMQ